MPRVREFPLAVLKQPIVNVPAIGDDTHVLSKTLKAFLQTIFAVRALLHEPMLRPGDDRLFRHAQNFGQLSRRRFLRQHGININLPEKILQRAKCRGSRPPSMRRVEEGDPL